MEREREREKGGKGGRYLKKFQELIGVRCIGL
jgi:hypothetical protein